MVLFFHVIAYYMGFGYGKYVMYLDLFFGEAAIFLILDLDFSSAFTDHFFVPELLFPPSLLIKKITSITYFNINIV